MNQLLRLAALVAFIAGIALCVIDDTPAEVDIHTAALIGLALWVGSTLVPDR